MHVHINAHILAELRSFDLSIHAVTAIFIEEQEIQNNLVLEFFFENSLLQKSLSESNNNFESKNKYLLYYNYYIYAYRSILRILVLFYVSLQFYLRGDPVRILPL